MNFNLLILILLLTSSCTQIIFQPDRYLYSRPQDIGYNVREEIVSSFDGTKLGAWFLFASPKKEKITQVKDKTLVVFFHGNAQNISAHFSVISWMSEAGIDVFLGDYRGYGISEGEPSTKEVVEDTKALLNKGYEYFQNGGYKKLIIYSQSLGGALTISALLDSSLGGSELQKKTSLLVLDSTFRSPKEVAHDKIWGLGYLLISENGFAKNLNHINIPTLVIHGDRDKVIPQKFGKNLFEMLVVPQKWWWDLAGMGHIETFHYKNGLQRTSFIHFLNSL